MYGIYCLGPGAAVALIYVIGGLQTILILNITDLLFEKGVHAIIIITNIQQEMIVIIARACSAQYPYPDPMHAAQTNGHGGVAVCTS